MNDSDRLCATPPISIGGRLRRQVGDDYVAQPGDYIEFIKILGFKGGSPILSVRIPTELLDLVDEVVARSATTRMEGPWTRSSFIVRAIEEKLEKMARSAGKSQSPLPESYGRDSSTF